MTLNAELTRRESEVAELLAWGAAKKEVADKLFISTRTVENTARSIYAKTGVQKATELCVWWFCSKCGVPTSLDPLKRAFIALFLLVVFIPRELTASGDIFRVGRGGTRTARVKTSRRRNDDEGTFNFSDFIKTETT
jgi:DNA-binding CsgD family transcriptional regulator